MSECKRCCQSYKRVTVEPLLQTERILSKTGLNSSRQTLDLGHVGVKVLIRNNIFFRRPRGARGHDFVSWGRMPWWCFLKTISSCLKAKGNTRLCSSNGRAVKAYASGTVDTDSIPSQVNPSSHLHEEKPTNLYSYFSWVLWSHSRNKETIIMTFSGMSRYLELKQ